MSIWFRFFVYPFAQIAATVEHSRAALNSVVSLKICRAPFFVSFIRHKKSKNIFPLKCIFSPQNLQTSVTGLLLYGSAKKGVGNLSLVAGQKQTLQGMAVLIFYQQFRSVAVYNVAKTWEFVEFVSN